MINHISLDQNEPAESIIILTIYDISIINNMNHINH